jgi:hypothetical protein
VSGPQSCQHGSLDKSSLTINHERYFDMQLFNSMKRGALSALAVTAILVGSAGSAFALDCTESIKAVQVEDSGKVLVQFSSNNSWHVISSDTSAWKNERFSMAVTSKLTGKRLFASWSSGSCSTTDYGSIATRVRLVD